MNSKTIIRFSRPRFRLYLMGPFLLGYATIIQHPIDFLSWGFLGWLLYFSLPANLLIYGINDIADYDTDKNNPKKQSYESLLSPDKQKIMRIAIITTNIPFLIRAITQGQTIYTTLLIFRFFGIFYSSKPIRAKTIPFIDGIYNILYIIPGYIGYFLAGGTTINPRVIIAGTLRCMAMHAYSAIPDIQSDKQAQLQTTATILKKHGTLIYCLICRTIASIIGYSLLGPITIIGRIVYMILITLSRNKNLFTLYKRFPIINGLIGMLLFIVLLTQ